MAFERDYKFTSIATNTTSFTGELPDSYETGDLLIWFVAKDTTGGGTNATPAGWTALDTWSDNAIRGAVFYKENVTGGSETDPVTTNADSDTWSGVIVSVGGVATSSTIEANVRIDTVQTNGCERSFTGPTTLTNNALVLHAFLNSGLNGCATDQGLQVISEEVGYAGESVYVFKETIATAGASAAGNQLQNANVATTYIGVSIADGSSGVDVEPYQTSGGMATLLNGFQGAENASWMPSGFPSGLVTDAFGTYGNLTTVNGSIADRYQDSGDKGVSFFLSAASTRGNRNNYKGLRFECDRTGGLATYDLTGKHIAGQMMMDVAKFSVQIGRRAILGYGVFLEDNAGNWKCFCINGSDSVRLFISALDGPFLIDPASSDVIDSNGTLDITNIQYMGFVVNGLSANNITTQISNLFIYEPIEVVGGTATQVITYDRLDSFGYGNMHRFRKVLGGASELVGAWHIGDGSVDTFLSIDGENIGIPETNSSGGLLIAEGFQGFKFNATAGSDISFINTTVSSPTEWKWDQASALGTQTYTSNIFTKIKPLTIDTGDYSDSTFTDCATVDQQGATLDGVVIDNSIDSIGMIRGTGSNSDMIIKNCTTGMEVDTAGSITFDNIQFSGNTTDVDFSTTGTLNIDLTNGSSTPTTSTTGGGTINITQNVTVSAANIIDDSRVQLYNVTKGAELDNSVVSGGSGYSFTANLADASVDDSDTLRLRVEYQVTTTAKESLETTGVITASGLSFLNTQVDDDVYNTYGIDGSTITDYTADYVDDEVDISVPTDFSVKELYAWWVYNKSTSQGISDFAGGVTAETGGIIRVNTAVVSIYLDNSTTNWIIQNDDVRFYRDDNAYPIKVPTTGGGCIDVEWRRDVALAQSSEVTAIKATVDANLDVAVSTRSTASEANIIAELDQTQAGIAALNNFDPATDTVANVTLVDTVTTNTDMRGTDGANTVVPDNANIAEAKDQATLTRKHMTNRDKIDETTNTLIRYEDDGTTVLLTFDLKDVDGNPGSTNIYEKDPQ